MKNLEFNPYQCRAGCSGAERADLKSLNLSLFALWCEAKILSHFGLITFVVLEKPVWGVARSGGAKLPPPFPIPCLILGFLLSKPISSG